MSDAFNEAVFENALVQYLVDELGYTHVFGPDVDRDYKDVLYEDNLRSSLERINPGVSREAIDAAIFTLKNRLSGNLIQRNEIFTAYLQNGLTVSIMENGKAIYPLIKLIDYDNIDNNSFIVANQWTIIEKEQKRPDVILFINGFPLVVMELKSCSRAQTSYSDAFLQLENYKMVIPSLFNYNAFCIISDMLVTKAGTITADENRYSQWKTVDGVTRNDNPDFTVLMKGMLEKSRLLDIIHNFILFQKEEKGDIKILAAYHQYHAVRKALQTTIAAIGKSRKGGVFWHTQGSGKSLSMVFLSHLLRNALPNPTIVVITDRNDLDDQLYLQFSKCKDFLRTDPKQAGSTKDLTETLSSTHYGGIFFTTMQKFEEADEPFSRRDDIIVLADEAHRSQYGLDERYDVKAQRMKKGTARVIRDALPNATFVGFTGTPIAKKDHNTIEVFGNCIDVYDMTQSVIDGATRPVYYESRVMNLSLNKDILENIDHILQDYVAEAEPEYSVNTEKTKRENATMEALLSAPETIHTLANDIITHYEAREDILTGKALVVAYSRPIAVLLYQEMMRLRPEWTEKVKVVMTHGNNDPAEWYEILGTESKKELAKKFKDDNDPMKIAIVVDMWLTGFDVPSLATMYVFKPMAGHNLMQAIARVNRVFKDKEGGLVVDYIGIATALKEAMKEYTERDQDNYGDTDISKTALITFRDKLEVCIDLFHGFNINPFITGSDYDRAMTVTNGLNFMLGDPKKKKLFLDAAYQLRQAASLCRSLLDKKERYYASFFETIRVSIHKIEDPGAKTGRSLKELSKQIKELLNQSVTSNGVINVFENIDTEFSLFDENFLKEVSALKEKNIASTLLRRLLQDKVHDYKKTNLVKAQVFSEKMEDIMNRWRNMQITNAEVIEELLKIAKEIKEAASEANSLGLTDEEMAFYDALTKPQAVKDFYENDQLVAMTKELTDMLKKNRTIDWSKKDIARARMRMLVKRLLKKYKYPPEEAEKALDTVLEQCELWTDNQTA